MNLYLIRHGESYGNLKGYNGPPNPKLTETGLHQAVLLGKALKKVPFDMILSSSYDRAIMTAGEIRKQQSKHVPMEIWPDLRETGEEFMYRIPSKKHIHELVEKDVVLQDFDLKKHTLYRWLGTESYNRKRAQIQIDLIKKRFIDMQNVAAVAHGTFNRYLISALLQTNPSHVFIGQGNTCINLFEVEKEKIKIQKINHADHLRE